MLTREDWLLQIINQLRPIYAAAEVPIPEQIRVSCGWPSRNALGAKSRRMGECWMVEASEDQVNQIFISPLVSDGAKAVRILAHELVHAALPSGTGHKKPFVKACIKVGITDGPPKSVEPGPELQEKINDILFNMDPYPHAALTPKSVDKKQSTRMLKIFCIGDADESPELHEEYVLRGSKKVIEKGLPICPVCKCEMKSDSGE
jgi:hypothetical protein